MKSYYYHSRLTIGWRIFNHIENSSSHTCNFDECIYHHIIIEYVCIAAKLLQHDYIIQRNIINRNQIFLLPLSIYIMLTLTQQIFRRL
jgi:hypothetical protein